MLKKYRVLEILQISSVTLIGLYYFSIQFRIHGDLSISNMEMVLRYLAILLHIAGAFWINEVYDFNSDKENPRKQLLEPADFYFFRKAAPACMLFSVLLAVYVGPWFVITICLLNVLAFSYSLPNIRFKSLPGLPQLIHFICGCAYFYVGAGPGRTLLTEHYIGMTFWGVFLAMASTMNEWMDLPYDNKAQDKTLMSLISSGMRKKFFLAHYTFTLLLFISWNMPFLTVVGISAISGIQYAILVLKRRSEEQKDILFFRNVYRVQMGLLIFLAVVFYWGRL